METLFVILGLLSFTYAIHEEWVACGVTLFVIICCVTWSITHNGLAY